MYTTLARLVQIRSCSIRASPVFHNKFKLSGTEKRVMSFLVPVRIAASSSGTDKGNRSRFMGMLEQGSG